MAGLCGLIKAELDQSPSLEALNTSKTAKGYREKVRLRNTGQGESADLRNLPITRLLVGVPKEEVFRQ